MSEWAEIPENLFELIAKKFTGHEDDLFELIDKKFTGYEDILALGLICKRWRALAVRCKETFIKKQTQQLPWLMLPPIKESDLHGFYNLTRRRSHQIKSCESNGNKCYSSRGWLLTVGWDWDMNLLHPMTLARFNLPGIESFGESRYERLSEPYVRFIHRAVLSSNPFLTSNFVLMVIQGCPTMPAYWRPGDKNWTLIDTTEVAFADAVFHQDKCYFITFWGKLLVTDFGISNPTTTEFITDFSEDLIQGDFFEALYLVIIEGSLLLVSREGSQSFRPEKEFQERPYQTVNFQVFKLDFKSLGWEELKNLGNWSLFVGQNSSMALNASVVKGCKPNSIYFTDDNTDFSHGTRKGAGFDMGIFNMTDQTIEPLIEGEWRNRVSPPIFVHLTF